jgi:hypothetical protein
MRARAIEEYPGSGISKSYHVNDSEQSGLCCSQHPHELITYGNVAKTKTITY